MCFNAVKVLEGKNPECSQWLTECGVSGDSVSSVHAGVLSICPMMSVWWSLKGKIQRQTQSKVTEGLTETAFVHYINKKYNLLRRHYNHEPISKCTNENAQIHNRCKSVQG